MKKYDEELARLSITYKKTLELNLENFKESITAVSQQSILGIGSGGSFSTAVLLCSLHENHTGRVSRALTPLEIISNPTLALNCPAFFISSEGKNTDILTAFSTANNFSPRALNVICNVERSELMEMSRNVDYIQKHCFPIDQKDGYLATNSLLLNSIVIARAYAELDGTIAPFPSELGNLNLANGSIQKWIDDNEVFFQKASLRQAILVVYSPLLKAVAVDLESKFAESAMLHCQITDMRSYAHGRHLWNVKRNDDVSVIFLSEIATDELLNKTLNHLPNDVLYCSLKLAGCNGEDLVAGLVCGMEIISKISNYFDFDPGRPEVPNSIRALHYLDYEVRSNLASRENSITGIVTKKDVLGIHWPREKNCDTLELEAQNAKKDLFDNIYRAIIFDYDGTLCHSSKRNCPPDELISGKITNLLKKGIKVGIATGRGNSVCNDLKEVIPKECWKNIWVGIYNGGKCFRLDEDEPENTKTNEFLNHVKRIANNLKKAGAPIETVRANHPIQVSIRFKKGVDSYHMWFVMADALKRHGLDSKRIVRSKHSVDVLGNDVSKSFLVSHLCKSEKIDPYRVLVIGDQGDWPGNDSTLLEHRYSLSVDRPSRNLDRGWNFAPRSKIDVEATLWYLEQINTFNCSFKINLPNNPQCNERRECSKIVSQSDGLD